MSNALTRPLAYAVLTPQGEVAWVTRDAAAAQAHEGEGWTVRPLYAHPPAAPVPPVVAGRWLVFNVGCIECGVSSNVVGLYDSEEEANRVASVLNKKHGWREGGQNDYEVFDLHAPTAAEYQRIITAALRPETRGSDA